MSRPPRFFISPDQVHGPHITVSGEDVRHVATVLRMKPGEALLLCDGNGTEYRVAIAEVGKSEIKTDILSLAKRDITTPRITLGQGLPKSDKMDWIAQKATELGVARIVPLITERTIVKIKDEEKRVSRWQKICREAAMQSNRPDIPSIGHIVSFKEFLRTGSTQATRLSSSKSYHHERLSNDPNGSTELAEVSELRTLKLLPWEEGTRPIKDVLRSSHGVKDVIVLIGPEGGFSEAEAAMAQAQGFHAVSLGPNILRTETAAITALGMLTYEYCS